MCPYEHQLQQGSYAITKTTIVFPRMKTSPDYRSHKHRMPLKYGPLAHYCHFKKNDQWHQRWVLFGINDLIICHLHMSSTPLVAETYPSTLWMERLHPLPYTRRNYTSTLWTQLRLSYTIVEVRAWMRHYRQVSNIRRTLVGNGIVDHSDVVGASPVGAAPTTSSFST